MTHRYIEQPLHASGGFILCYFFFCDRVLSCKSELVSKRGSCLSLLGVKLQAGMYHHTQPCVLCLNTYVGRRKGSNSSLTCSLQGSESSEAVRPGGGLPPYHSPSSSWCHCPMVGGGAR